MRSHFWKSILFYLGLVIGLVSCATVVPPTGGSKDDEGPVLLGVVPYPGALNFTGSEVSFYFDEFLKPGNYGSEVFISPVPASKPEIIVYNKRLSVRFNEVLRENTTYVITLGTGIKDFNEGNKLDASVTYAFCTGDVLDTLSFKGNVINAATSQGQAEMTLMLFPENEVEGDSILGVKPVYIVETDENGNFNFRYLQNGRYKLYGVKDVDNSFSYSQFKEKLALAAQPLIDLEDTARLSKPVELLAFEQDNTPAQVRSVRWANDYCIHVEFSEQVRDSFADRKLQFYLQDTSGKDSAAIPIFRFKDQDRSHLYLAAPRKRDRARILAFTDVMDSLGYAADTAVKFSQDNLAREDRKRWFEAPAFLPERSAIVLPALFQLPAKIEGKSLRLVDSLGKAVEVKISTKGMEAYLLLQKLPLPNRPYFVEVKPGIALPDGKLLDTTMRFPIVFPDPKSFGSVSGTIVGDSAKPGMRYVVTIKGKPAAAAAAAAASKGASKAAEKPKVWTRTLYGPGPFTLEFVPEGTYEVSIIEDENGDGALTPGSLVPYRMPERAIVDVAPIDVKANWDMTNYKISCVPDKKFAKAGGKGKGKAVVDPNANPDAPLPETVPEDVPFDDGQ